MTVADLLLILQRAPLGATIEVIDGLEGAAPVEDHAITKYDGTGRRFVLSSRVMGNQYREVHHYEEKS